jgi:hypothetical protein
LATQAVIDLMTRLSTDRKAAQDFKRNPEQAFAGLDLTELEKALLKRSEPGEIRSYFGDGGPVLCIFMTCEN